MWWSLRWQDQCQLTIQGCFSILSFHISDCKGKHSTKHSNSWQAHVTSLWNEKVSSSLTSHSFRCAFNFRSGNEIQFPTKIRLSLQNWNWIFIRRRKEKTEDDSSSGSKPEQLDQWHEVKKLYLEEKENRVWTKRLTGFSFSFPSLSFFLLLILCLKKRTQSEKEKTEETRKPGDLLISWFSVSVS